MLLAPAGAVYLAEGMRWLKLKAGRVHMFFLIGLIALDLALAAYYFL